MNLKKFLTGVLACCVMGGTMPSVAMPANNAVITASAADYTEGTYELLTYINYGDYIEITGCDKSATSVVIPDIIDGVPVTSIGEDAFWGHSSLREITIPDSITSIGNYAFYRCTGMTEITIPDSVTIIGTNVFGGCSELTAINVDDNNNNYADIDGVLFNKYKIKLLSYPNGKSETYTIPDSVTIIGKCAFDNCIGLTEIIIPDSVTSIGERAFEGTSWLEARRKENPLVIVNGILIDGTTCSGDVVIPESVTSIGKCAFDNCSGLTEITIPDSIISIGYGAFYDCTGLTKITILNPNCNIYDKVDTIIDTATIYGYENSTAQAYVEKYNRKFVPLSEVPDNILGDVNKDGAFNVSDVVLLQKWLLAVPDVELADWKAGDLCEDGRLDVFDLCMMKRMLVKNS